MLRDTRLCRRLRPSVFLDGMAVPCAMFTDPQLCDICEAEMSCAPPKIGPARFPFDLNSSSNQKKPATSSELGCVNTPAPKPLGARSTRHFAPDPPSPLNRVSPLITFGGHALDPTGILEESGLRIHVACMALAESCVNCWSHGLDYNHSLLNCDCGYDRSHPEWKSWIKHLRLPAGCCVYCGCPSNVCLFDVRHSS
jgi:hypothetical protein